MLNYEKEFIKKTFLKIIKRAIVNNNLLMQQLSVDATIIN